MALTAEEQAELDQLEAQIGPSVMDEPAIQEQHPSISFKERAVAKNLANSPEAQVAYLRLQHPELQIKVQGDQVIAKGPNESQYKVLDPQGFDIQDITDVGYDVASGVGTGAATAAGGVAGAGAGGVGAIPGAAIAGSGTAMYLDDLRQKLGRDMGIPQSTDWGQIGRQGIAGAASPVVFGTGASASKMLQAGVAPETQRSLLTRGVQKIAPKFAEAVSGVPESAIKTQYSSGKDVAALKETGITDLAENAYQTLREGLAKKKNQVGKLLEQEIVKSPRPVDISGAKASIDAQIMKLEGSALSKNPEVLEKISELKDARQKMFGQVTGQDEAGNAIVQDMPDFVDAKTAFELQELLKQSGDLGRIKGGLKGRFGDSTAKADKEWGSASLDAYKELNSKLNDATDGMSGKFKTDYKRYIDLQKKLDTHFKTPEKTAQTLQGLNAPSKQMLKETLGEVKDSTGVDLSGDARLLEAYKYFNDPKLMPISGGGTVSTGRSIGLGAMGGGAGYMMGGIPGAAIGAQAGNLVGSPAAIKAYTGAASYLGNKLPNAGSMGAIAPQRMTQPIWNALQRRK